MYSVDGRAVSTEMRLEEPDHVTLPAFLAASALAVTSLKRLPETGRKTARSLTHLFCVVLSLYFSLYRPVILTIFNLAL